MLKKSLFIFTIVYCLSSAVLADETNLIIQDANTQYSVSESNNANINSNKDKQKKEKEVKEKIKNKQNNKTKLKKAKEFKSITNCNNRAKRNNVAHYIRFIYGNDFADDRLEAINRILDSGTTIQSLKQVYDFWLTTDEDFALVEQICALEDEYFSEYWYENAFNKLTNHIHGELSGSEIIEYQHKGISIDEIFAANVMCRKQGQNIHSILDSVLLGNSIEAQAKQIYGAELNVTDKTLFDAVSELAKATKLGGQPLVVNGELLLEKDIFDDVINEIISDEISELNLGEEKTTMAEDYISLMNSKYPLSTQRALMNKGFTPQEIEKSAHISEKNIFKAVKIAREMLKTNEK